MMNKEDNTSGQKVVLHVGAGPRGNSACLPSVFDGWKEVRLDINPAYEPDILGSIVSMDEVADESVDAVYSSHNIEHVHTYQIDSVLREFHRVLRQDGFVLLTCPDLQAVCQLVVEDRLEETAYISPAGPIRPIDILFGHAGYVARGNEFMQHKTGFTRTSLMRHLQTAGFKGVAVERGQKDFALWAIAIKESLNAVLLQQLQGMHPL